MEMEEEEEGGGLVCDCISHTRDRELFPIRHTGGAGPNESRNLPGEESAGMAWHHSTWGAFGGESMYIARLHYYY